MFFASFESYHDAIEKASGMVVRVELHDGHLHYSSAMPTDSLAAVLTDMENCYENKSVFMIWNRMDNQLITIPYEKINSITIEFTKSV